MSVSKGLREEKMLPPKSSLDADIEFELMRWDTTFLGQEFTDTTALEEALAKDPRFIPELKNSTMDEFAHSSMMNSHVKTYLAAYRADPTRYKNIAYDCLVEDKIIGGSPKMTARKNDRPTQHYRGIDFKCNQCPHLLYSWTKSIA